jgi:hypothetical protein
LPADLGELYVLRLPLDQFDPEVFLQLLQLRGQGGLADEGALGGPAEVAGVGQSHQVLQILEIHDFLIHREILSM